MAEIDQKVVIAARNGSEEAFAQIVETFQTPVYNLCYRMLYNEGEAEEAAQETFWKAWTNFKAFDTSRSFPTWLLSIAAHYCIDRKRKKQVPQVEIDETMEEILPERTPQPVEEVAKKDREEKIRSLLEKLNDTDRAAMIMRYWDELSEKEIAEALDITESAVKSRLFRARKQIASLWQQSDPDDGGFYG